MLATAPFDRLDGPASSPSSRQTLRADPVAAGRPGCWRPGRCSPLLVAAAAVVLLVVAERYDDAAQAYAWEADGVAPATLRGALWWRAVAVAVPAVPAGVLAGVVLSRVTARLVAVTATAVTPQPPLVAGHRARLGAGAAAAGGVAVALALAGAGRAGRRCASRCRCADAGALR